MGWWRLVVRGKSSLLLQFFNLAYLNSRHVLQWNYISVQSLSDKTRTTSNAGGFDPGIAHTLPSPLTPQISKFDSEWSRYRQSHLLILVRSNFALIDLSEAADHFFMIRTLQDVGWVCPCRRVGSRLVRVVCVWSFGILVRRWIAE